MRTILGMEQKALSEVKFLSDFLYIFQELSLHFCSDCLESRYDSMLMYSAEETLDSSKSVSSSKEIIPILYSPYLLQ